MFQVMVSLNLSDLYTFIHVIYTFSDRLCFENGIRALCTWMVMTEWICLLAVSKAQWALRALWILMALKWWKTADVKRSLFSALAFSNA